jgi:predicted CoA-binding protein
VTTDDAAIRSLLTGARTIAVVGASQKAWRESYSIMQFLQRAGYTVYPVNPAYRQIDSTKCYRVLRDIPGPVDIVNVFRNPEFVLPVAQEAAAIHAKTLWLQSGVINQEAAEFAERAGLNVVMDRCIRLMYRFLVEQ